MLVGGNQGKVNKVFKATRKKTRYVYKKRQVELENIIKD